MNKIIKYFKDLIVSFLLWLKPPKIGRIDIEIPEPPLEQDVRVNHDKLEVDLEEWKDAFKDIFESDSFVDEKAGITRVVRPSDEVLKNKSKRFSKITES